MTTGAPLTIEFANTDTHSQDYATVARHYRPSHADLVAYHRFNGFNDPRGGGHFSARLTVAFVAAGVVAKKMLPPGIAFDTRLTGASRLCRGPCYLRGGPYNRMRSNNGYRLYPIHLNTNERQKRRSQNTRQSVQLLAGGILDPCSIIYIHSRMDLGLPVASA